MLLRAGVLYGLAAACLLLLVGLLWGRLELGSTRETAVALQERVRFLQSELEGERSKAERAERRALVAEDSLQKVQQAQAEAESGATLTRLKIAEELTAALRARDQARRETARLTRELETAQSLLKVAEMAASAARADAERLASERAKAVTEALATAAAAQAAGSGGQKDVGPATPAQATPAPTTTSSIDKASKGAKKVSTATGSKSAPSAAPATAASNLTEAPAATGAVETYQIVPARPEGDAPAGGEPKAKSNSGKAADAAKASKAKADAKAADRKRDAKTGSNKAANKTRKGDAPPVRKSEGEGNTLAKDFGLTLPN